MDKLCHASLIDAVRDSVRSFRVFPHNHLSKLRRLLEEREAGQLQVVVTESIFSMDGDAADLPGLAALKKEHPFVLLLDEAHGTGVYGPDGSGYAAECEVRESVDVSVVTLSKALGVAGGAVCGSRTFCDALVNYGRAYVYSTAVPPSVAAAAEAAVAVIRSEPHRRQRLRGLARRVRSELAAGRPVPLPADSPIVPVVLGSEEAALDAAERLRREGLFVPAIRPPTVPKGSSRLRVTLCCDHTDGEVDLLIRTLGALPTR
jgi:8-amino-7-oxononanoate synthase